MNLFIPEPTRYDWSFRLFGIPVRVHPGFWLVHAGLGLFIAYLFPSSIAFLGFFIWIGCAFVSILLHELGHALAGRWLGAEGEVVLTAMGGLAGGSSDLHRRSHRILVYLAGPLAQLLLAGLVLLALPLVVERLDPGSPLTTLADLTSAMLLFLNIGCPLINLIPIPPLDGGRILLEVIEWFRFGDPPPWERDPDWWKRG